MQTCLPNHPGRRFRAALLLLMFLAFGPLRASDLMEVTPVTNRILMVYLKDGHINSFGVGQSPANNVVYQNATNVIAAATKTNYVITSPDDGNYATAKNPVNLGRKSKGLDYNDEGQAVPYVWRHWIYIELPTGMVQGKTYTVQLNNLVRK